MLKAKIEYFKNLDGLRFLCFLSVFTVHSLHTQNKLMQDNLFFKYVVEGLFANGGLGVNFFFVLSGFLITYLLIKEKQSTGKINILHFWFKRVIRIWPLYFLCVVFGFVIFPFLKQAFGEVPKETAELKYYLSFLVNFDILKNGSPDSTELGVLWSVSIEEQFYLLWPILLYIFPIKRYWIIFLCVIIFSLTFRAVNLQKDNAVFYYHTFSCMSDLAVGAFGAWLINFPKFAETISLLTKPKIITVYILFFICFVFKKQIFDQTSITRILERFCISILIILIILEQNFSKNSFYKIGDFKTISKLGITTYGMYMLHVIAILIITTMIKLFKLSDNIYVVLLIGPVFSLLLSIVMSKISYNLIEKRFLNLRKLLK